jgi:hypothetical protein
MAMSDGSWEEQFKQFLRKTGEDVRRTGEDVRAEAQRLLDAAKDPEKQQRVRDRLKEFTVWARKTAQGVAGAVEEVASKAETAFHRAADKVSEATEKATGAQRKSSRSGAGAPGETDTPAHVRSAARKPAAAAGKASKARVKPGKPGPKKAAKRRR